MLREAYRQRWRRWLNRRIPPARAVQLNQRRIFILPTPRGLAFSVVLLLSGMAIGALGSAISLRKFLNV